MKNTLRLVLKNFGYGVLSSARLNDLVTTEQLSHELIELLSELSGTSYAQLKQDIFVLLATGFKKRGYFVEFGATNGKDLSNTYLLETRYGWNGILAEPAPIWHSELQKNRSCHIEHNCVWSESNEFLEFTLASTHEHSGLAQTHQQANKASIGESFEVKTISLLDLLRRYRAPRVIDYLSLDTEGSELRILQAFDFEQYKFSIIHVEHNYRTTDQAAVFDLLTSHGYTRRHQNFSLWDDWYYRDDLLSDDSLR